MLRPLLTVSFIVAVAPRLAAQDKPTAAVQQAISGTWQFDQAHSDTVTGDPLAHAVMNRAITGGSGPAGGGGGGGGGGGKGGKGGGGAAAASTLAPVKDTTQPVAPRPHYDAHTQIVMADVDPGAGYVIAANDSTVAMATAAMVKSGTQVNWKTDGKKHQAAQMDGTIIETQAGWQDGTLTLLTNIPGVGSLKREFEVSKDGKTLKVKESIDVGGRKADKKLVFDKKQ